jgi:hypothetical protein
MCARLLSFIVYISIYSLFWEKLPDDDGDTFLCLWGWREDVEDTCLLTAAVLDHVPTDDLETTKERLSIYPTKPADLSYRKYRRHNSHGGRHVLLYVRSAPSSRGLDDDGTDSSYFVSQRGIHISKEERCKTCYNIQVETPKE